MVEVESAEKVARRTSRHRACNDKHGVTGDDTERSMHRWSKSRAPRRWLGEHVVVRPATTAWCNRGRYEEEHG